MSTGDSACSFTPYPKLILGDTRGWERLAKLGDTVELAPYELLINPKGADDVYCYVVTEGNLMARKFRSGRESVACNIRSRGALLFEVHALVETDQREVFFEALEHSVLKRITHRQLRDAVAADPELCFVLVDSLFEKLASSMDQFEDSHTRTVTERLLSLLQELAWAARTPQDDPDWLHSDIHLSQQSIADMLCVNRVTVAKALNTLKERGAIHMQGRRILVART